MFTGNGPRKDRPKSSEIVGTGAERLSSLRTIGLAVAASIVFTAGWLPIDGTTSPDGSAPFRPTAAIRIDPADVPGSDAATGPWFVYGADAAEQAEFVEAVGLYAAAGLPLPALQVYFHDSAEDCNGHMGLFSKGGDKHRVDICEAYPAVIRHELAHAWEHHYTTDATRRAFLDRIGVAEWNRQETPTRSRAIERVADLVVWGIGSRPIQLMHATKYGEDLETYELLTGRPSPRIAHWDDFAPRQAGVRPNIPPSELPARANLS